MVEARGRLQGYAQRGSTIVTSGTSSTDKALKVYPNCTVTFYQAGTTNLLTRYTDNAGTVGANPTTADSTGYYFGYFDSGIVDIRFSGTGITSPFTLGDVLVFEVGTTSGSICYANQMTGANAAVKINACDALLSTNPGTIYYLGGGTISTDVVISQYHTLHLGAGTYQLAIGTEHNSTIQFKDDVVIEGEGAQTIIKQSSGNHDSNYLEFVAIQGFAQYNTNGSVARNVTIRNLQLLKNRADFDSVRSGIALGNCHHCFIEQVVLTNWGSIGVSFGAAPSGGTDPYSLGHFAEDVWVENSTFTGVASQNVAPVNSKNFHIINNHFNVPGQTGGPSVAVIDCETNTGSDLMEGGEITDNIIDARLSPVTVNGISYNASTQNGPATISLNQIWGRTLGGASGNLSNGIISTGSARDVSIIGNTVIGAAQSGLSLGGTRYTAIGNSLFDTGGAGAGAGSIACIGCSNSSFGSNYLYSPDLGYLDSVVETSGATGNRYIGNYVPSGTTLLGTSSVRGEMRADGNSYNYSASASNFTAFQDRARFNGATSGTIDVKAQAVAGSNTLTLPAATDTLVGKATTDVLTNKTYDTAGTGNSLLVNGVAVTANTGTGAVARAASPTFTTPTIGAATATSINFGGATFSTYTDTTCTLTLKFGGATTGITTSSNVCKYKQIGNMVYLQLEMILTSKGSATGSATLTGLPVNASATANFQQVGFLYLVGSYTGTTNVFTDTSTPSQLLLYVNNAGTGTALADTNFTNSSIIILNIAYSVN